MLKDLNLLGSTSKQNYHEHYQWREVTLSPVVREKFKEFVEEKGQKCLLGDHTSRIIRDEKTIDVPHQWFDIATYFVDYCIEARKYQDLAHKIYEHLVSQVPNFDAGPGELYDVIRDSGDQYLTILEVTFDTNVMTGFTASVNFLIPDAADRGLFLKCITDEKWAHSGKNIGRGQRDYHVSGILALASVVQATQGYLSEVVEFFSDNPTLVNNFTEGAATNMPPIPEVSPAMTSLTIGQNLIVYGAPGAGKSTRLKEKMQGAKVVKTVFHQEYQNTDFVGGLRPSKDGEKITYSFVPGPFTNALLLAYNHPDQEVILLIEEINRANAAAVFGEIFQLLDRKNGKSEYTITPDETWKKYLQEKKYKDANHVYLPGNLSIFATMNSSDQGVFLLDTAFKRRWAFEYCRIDFDKHKDTPSFKNPIIRYKGVKCSWSTFAQAINEDLKKLDIEEDRQISPFFLSEEERGGEDLCTKAVAGKLLIYLWDDVLRHNRKRFFNAEINTFSDLVKKFEDGASIFHPATDTQILAPQQQAA